MRKTRRSLQAAVAVSAATVALAACSSQGGAQNAGGGDAAEGESYTIAMVTHEAPGDTFWDKIRNGAEAAAANHNITLNYSNNQDAGEQSTLIQNAIDQGVDGLATTLPTPDAIGPNVQKAVDAGIPTVAFNAGINDYKNYGVNMYFGSDEDLAGQTVGQRLTTENGGELPANVHGVLDACVHPEAASRRQRVRGVAGQEHAPVPHRRLHVAAHRQDALVGDRAGGQLPAVLPVPEPGGQLVPDAVVGPGGGVGAVGHLQVEPAHRRGPHRVQREPVRVPRVDQLVGGRRDVGQDPEPRVRVHALVLFGRRGRGA